MTPAPKRFAWHDRDTAARDLLQLATYAPPTIRLRALQLLKAFRSPAIFSELEQIVLDESGDIWERRYALHAIAVMPGDLYLPQFAPFAVPGEIFTSKLSLEDFISLVCRHPRNLDWFFGEIQQLSPREYLQTLHKLSIFYDSADNLLPALAHRIKAILEQHPLLLDIELIRTLYEDTSDSTRQWLKDRWDTIVYLCLVANLKETLLLFMEWDELREHIFRNCAPLQEEYTQKMQEIEARRALRQEFDYQKSPLWQELHSLYTRALNNDMDAYASLESIVRYERKKLSKRAVATNLLGKLKHKYTVRPALIHALRYGPVDPRYKDQDLDASVRFEAGEALRDIPSPAVWEAMVDAFFINPKNVLESFMSNWIAYLTDRLSGLAGEYSDAIWPENTRPWFHGLVDESAEP